MKYAELLKLYLNDRPQNLTVKEKLSLNMFLREVWPQRLTSWVSTCLSKSHPSPNLNSNCCVPGRVIPYTLPIPSRSQVWSLVTQPEREVQVGSGANDGSSTHLGPAPINTCRPSPISHIFLWNLWKNGCSVNSSQSKQVNWWAKLSFQTSTVCQPVQSVAFMAETFKASRVVDAGVITGPFKGTLVYIWIHRKNIEKLEFIWTE